MTAKKMGEAGENPLVPNAKLRQMYTLMFEARTLDEAVTKKAGSKGKKRIVTIHGQEAVRVSTAIELGPEDLVSDETATAGMGLILGGDPASLLRGLSKTKPDAEKVLTKSGVNRALRGTESDEERLWLAVGAALALKKQARQGVVTTYVRKNRMAPAAWRRVLSAAAKLELPILFIVLPENDATKKDSDLTELCGIAKEAGVPGIPVDTCDAVALYRVMQESLGRMRSGDGPVLIESVHWRAKGRRSASNDPLDHLKEFLLQRNLCNAGWFQQTVKATRKRLFKKRSASKNASSK